MHGSVQVYPPPLAVVPPLFVLVWTSLHVQPAHDDAIAIVASGPAARAISDRRIRSDPEEFRGGLGGFSDPPIMTRGFPDPPFLKSRAAMPASAAPRSQIAGWGVSSAPTTVQPQPAAAGFV